VSIQDEVFSIAEDRSREDCFRRARQAFDFANERRARFTSILDTPKRLDAVTQAVYWAEIAWFLDVTAAEAFTMAGYEEETAPCGCLWHRASAPLRHALGFLNLRGWYASLSAAFGTKPIEFYELPDTAQAGQT
jgi:hypothetical protein